jgi:hypothetical protein
MTTRQDTPVLDDWDGYEFPEESVTAGNHRLVVRDATQNAQPNEYAPFRFDQRLRNEDARSMKVATDAVHRKLMIDQSFSPVARRVGGAPVHWLLFSPYEIYLEKVFSERLKTLENGELR